MSGFGLKQLVYISLKQSADSVLSHGVYEKMNAPKFKVYNGPCVPMAHKWHLGPFRCHISTTGCVFIRLS